MQYAGANNPLYLIPSEKEPVENRKFPDFVTYDEKIGICEVKADKMPIGIYHGDEMPANSRHG